MTLREIEKEILLKNISASVFCLGQVFLHVLWRSPRVCCGQFHYVAMDAGPGINARLHGHTPEVSRAVCSGKLLILNMSPSPCFQISCFLVCVVSPLWTLSTPGGGQGARFLLTLTLVMLYCPRRNMALRKDGSLTCILAQGALSNSTVTPVLLPFLCAR